MMSNPTRTPTQIQSQTQNPIQSQTQIQTRPDSRSNADTRSGETHYAFYRSRTQYGSNITVGI